MHQWWSIFISKEVANSGNTLFIAILGLFTPYDGSVGAFNTTSRVPYIAISLSFDNTRICAPMAKCIHLKNVCNSGNILFFLTIIRFFTPYGGSVGGFNTTSRVPYIAIPLSFDNTRKNLTGRNEIPKKSKIIAPYCLRRSRSVVALSLEVSPSGSSSSASSPTSSSSSTPLPTLSSTASSAPGSDKR